MTPKFVAQGIDYAWGRPRYASLKAAGVRFVMRYISHDNGKDLLAAEKKSLDSVGVIYGLVFETTAGRALAGRAAGVADARHADDRRKALGLPDIPIYFAVDFDASSSQMPTVAAYIAGAASVLGEPETGAYGGYRVVSYLAARDVCDWFWQTYAWSGGAILGRLRALLSRPKVLRAVSHPEAHVYQYRNGVSVAGVSADWNKATATGLRSLRPAPKPPKPRKYASRVLKQGDSGEDVHELQRVLTIHGSPFIAIDGRYGPETEKAKRLAMFKLGWPQKTIDDRAKSKSIGRAGQRSLRSPSTRPQSYKDREKQRSKKP